MKMSIGWLFCGTILMIGCSDATAPAPGMFQARLSGARVASMSGVSNGRAGFTEEAGAQFGIGMFALERDTARSISISWPGDQPPAPGTYALNGSGSECSGGYTRSFSSFETGTTFLEQLSASSGRVIVSSSSGGQVMGTFIFTGILVAGSDSVGSVTASGAFSAEVIP
jgi:hypothetical protein